MKSIFDRYLQLHNADPMEHPLTYVDDLNKYFQIINKEYFRNELYINVIDLTPAGGFFTIEVSIEYKKFTITESLQYLERLHDLYSIKFKITNIKTTESGSLL